MKRGDIVIAAAKGEFLGKPRPCVVIQATPDGPTTITLCPITSRSTGMALIRIPIRSDVATGLEADSEIQTDRITTIRRVRVRETIGTVPNEIMTQVDAALRRWLAL